MKLYNFPEKKSWDGRWKSQEHKAEPYRRTESEIYRRALNKAEDELHNLELAVIKAKRKVEDAKRRYFQTLEVTNEEQ
jgi:hypothetical protein